MLASIRADRETAARITEEIGNLMKEIETLVEEKKKDSPDMKFIEPQEGKCVVLGFALVLMERRPGWRMEVVQFRGFIRTL